MPQTPLDRDAGLLLLTFLALLAPYRSAHRRCEHPSMADDLASFGPLVFGDITVPCDLTRLTRRRPSQFSPALRVSVSPCVRERRLRLAQQTTRGQSERRVHHRHRAGPISVTGLAIDSHLCGSVGSRTRVLALPMPVGLRLCCAQIIFGVQ